MAFDLRSWMSALESAGFYDVLLPFLLVFVLSYAVLAKVKIFGERGGTVNFIVALIIGILFVRNNTLVEFIQAYLPNVSVVVVVILGFLIILGLFGVSGNAFTGGLMVFLVLVSLAGGIWALTQASEQGNIDLSLGPLGELDMTTEEAGVFLVMGIFLLIVMLAVLQKPKNPLDGLKNIGNAFSGKLS